jgi:hypothetical protein
MLREILGVCQDEPNVERRWFHSDYFDLFVWQSNTGHLRSFQLCYGITGSEKALVWEEESGYFHDGVEEAAIASGDVLGLSPQDREGPDPIVSRFDLAARSLPDALRAEISDRVHQYAAHAELAELRRKQFRRADWQQKSETR